MPIDNNLAHIGRSSRMRVRDEPPLDAVPSRSPAPSTNEHDDEESPAHFIVDLVHTGVREAPSLEWIVSLQSRREHLVGAILRASVYTLSNTPRNDRTASQEVRWRVWQDVHQNFVDVGPEAVGLAVCVLQVVLHGALGELADVVAEEERGEMGDGESEQVGEASSGDDVLEGVDSSELFP